jgi:hypothetical protein
VVGTAAIWGGSPPPLVLTQNIGSIAADTAASKEKRLRARGLSDVVAGVSPAKARGSSALFFPEAKQKYKGAQSRENRSGDEACGRNLSARLKTCFQVSSNADQKKQKSHADQNQTDRFLVIGRNLHLVVSNQI